MKKVTMREEFKTFIGSGLVVDLGIAVTLSTAFSQLITVIINDAISPWLLYFMGFAELNEFALVFDPVIIRLGPVIHALIHFIVVICTVFFVVKTINSVREKITGQHISLQEEPTEKDILKEIHQDVKQKVKKIKIEPATMKAEKAAAKSSSKSRSQEKQ